MQKKFYFFWNCIVNDNFYVAMSSGLYFCQDLSGLESAFPKKNPP